MKNTLKELLVELNACENAREFVNDMEIEESVATVQRGDWLLWLAQRVGIDIRPLTLAKARCAKTVIHLMKDERSINAVNIAEKFGLGEVTLDELNAAYSAAYSAARAATYAADAADAADAAYSAADASYSAASAADACYSAARAAAYAADAAYSARTKNKKLTADICREILGQLIIDKVNLML